MGGNPEPKFEFIEPYKEPGEVDDYEEDVKIEDVEKEVEGNKEHTLSTESEFSPNDVVIKTERGELYFVEQYIKMGAFVGGAGLKQADTETGKKEVLKHKLAKQGKCSAKKS